MIKKCNSIRRCVICGNVIPDSLPNNARTDKEICSRELGNQRRMNWYYKDKARKRKKNTIKVNPISKLMVHDPKVVLPYPITEKELKQFKKDYLRLGIPVYKKGVRVL